MHRVCSQIGGRDKLVAPKLDGLYKHCGKKKTQVDTLRQLKSTIYFKNNNMHQKNEKQFASQSHTTNKYVLALRERISKNVANL
jgi:hypothetical protein